MAQTTYSFSYHGELIDGGVLVNDIYDIRVTLIDGDSNPVGSPSFSLDVPVSEGDFTIPVDIAGVAIFDISKNYFFEIAVRKTAIGGLYITLSPAQPLLTVPYAADLASSNATQGQALIFDGSQWVPYSGRPSLQSVSGSDIQFTGSTLKAGNAVSSPFRVTSGVDYTATFDGGDDMYVMFKENGQNRGYVGSYISPGTSGVNDSDFEVGTTNNNSGSVHLVTGFNEPRLTITSAGNVKIIKELSVQGNLKQLSTSNGMMKFMVEATCGSTLSSIAKQYNGISDSSANVTIANGASAGECILTFPVSLSQRYWQVTALGAGDRGANCTAGVTTNKVRCTRFRSSTGSEVQGVIMLLIY